MKETLVGFPKCNFNGCSDERLEYLLIQAISYRDLDRMTYVCSALRMSDDEANILSLLPPEIQNLGALLCLQAGIFGVIALHASRNGHAGAKRMLEDIADVTSPHISSIFFERYIEDLDASDDIVTAATGFSTLADYRRAWVNEIIIDLQDRLRNK